MYINDLMENTCAVRAHLLFSKIYTRQNVLLETSGNMKSLEKLLYMDERDRQPDKFSYLLQKLRPSRRLGLKCQFKYLKLNRRMCQSSE